jgi:putative endopeptidase
MDEAQIDIAGVRPLEPEFERLGRISDLKSLQAEIGRLQGLGVNALFHFGSQQDRKDSTKVIGGAGQAGLGLPDRDYYTKTDEKSQQIREQYVQHVEKMFEMLGDDSARAAAEARKVLEIETKLAEASMTRVERRDPDATYHKMDRAGLHSLMPSFSWDGYLNELGYPGIKEVNIMPATDFAYGAFRDFAELIMPAFR